MADSNQQDVEQPIVVNKTTNKSASNVVVDSASQQSTNKGLSFASVALKALGLGILLFAAMWGALAAADATSTPRFISEDKLSSDPKSMDEAVDAWAKGKTVVIQGASRMVSLSATKADGFWIFSETVNSVTVNGVVVSDRKSVYEYYSRGDNGQQIILRAECTMDKDGSCTMIDIQ